MVSLPEWPTKLSLRDQQLLHAVYTYGITTSWDMAHLEGFSPTSHSHVRERMSRLAGNADFVNHYLIRLPVPDTTRGNPQRAFVPGRKGLELIANERELHAADSCYSPSKSKLERLSYLFVRHNLLVTRLICALRYWERSQSQREYVLTECRMCYQMARDPAMQVRGEDGKITRVVPDGWVYLAGLTDNRQDTALWIEADCGTTGKKKYQESQRARIAFLRNHHYERAFGTPIVLLLTVTIGQFPSERERETRRHKLQVWTQDVIKDVISEKNRQAWFEKFYFAAVDYSEIYNLALWTQPVWQNPGSSKQVSLFDTTTPTDQPATSADEEETTDGDDSFKSDHRD